MRPLMNSLMWFRFFTLFGNVENAPVTVAPFPDNASDIFCLVCCRRDRFSCIVLFDISIFVFVRVIL